MRRPRDPKPPRRRQRGPQPRPRHRLEARALDRRRERPVGQPHQPLADRRHRKPLALRQVAVARAPCRVPTNRPDRARAHPRPRRPANCHTRGARSAAPVHTLAERRPLHAIASLLVHESLPPRPVADRNSSTTARPPASPAMAGPASGGAACRTAPSAAGPACPGRSSARSRRPRRSPGRSPRCRSDATGKDRSRPAARR